MEDWRVKDDCHGDGAAIGGGALLSRAQLNVGFNRHGLSTLFYDRVVEIKY